VTPADIERLGRIERLSRDIVPGSGVLDIQHLSSGLLNETYRVTRDGHTYALRVAAAQPINLAVDRNWEARVLENAGHSGIAPPLVYCDPQNGVLLAGWVEGRSWSAQDARKSANIERFARLVRRVHGLGIPTPARVLSPMKWADVYGAALSQGPESPRDDLRTAAAARLAELADLPGVAAVVCHSDLHVMNLIERGDSLILLDWEYAHVSEALWDLAGWSANNDFEGDAEQELLWSYWGMAPTPSQWRRFRLLGWLYDYICLLWCELYLRLRGGADTGVSARATQLDARLRLPAHYAA